MFTTGICESSCKTFVPWVRKRYLVCAFSNSKCNESLTCTLTAQRRVDGGDQVIPRRAFQDIAKRAGFQAARHQARVAVHRHQHDTSVGVQPQDRGGGGNPVHVRHRDVADDHVRRQPLRVLDQRPAVGDVRHHVELGLQQSAQLFSGLEMVVGQEQPDSGRHDVDVAQCSEARVRLAEGNYVAGRAKRTAGVEKSYLGGIRRNY